MKTFTLSNGLEVCFHELPNATDTRVQIAYRFGSNAEDGPNEAGLAHVVEHMIFKGTNGSYDGAEARVAPDLMSNAAGLQFSETDIVRCARLMGASFNAFTTVNKTSYYFQTEKEFTLPFLLILSSSMFRSRMDEQMLFSEKKAVLEEMYAGKDNLVRFALKSLRKKMYKPNDAQFHPTIGTESAVVALDGKGLRAFYDRNYNPNNATLFITGAMVPRLEDTVRELFDKPVSSAAAFLPRKPCSKPPAATVDSKAFHALPDGHSVAVVAARVDGAWGKPLRGKAWGFLTNYYGGRGTRSRLWESFVQDGTADSASVFTDIDRYTGEVYFVVDYGAKVPLKPKALRAKIQAVWDTTYSVEDLVEYKNADELSTAHQHGNLEAFTNDWVEEHYKIGSAEAALPSNNYTLDDLSAEVHGIHSAPLKFHVLQINSGKSDGSANSHGVHEALVSKLAQRTEESVQESMEIGSPMRDAFQRCWGYLLELSSPPASPKLARVGSQWRFVVQKDAALTQLAVRPFAIDAVRATEEGYALSLLGTVLKLALDPSHYDREGISVRSSGLATVGVTTSAQDPGILDGPTTLYASSLDDDTESFIVDWWEKNGEKTRAQWHNAHTAASHDPTQIVYELHAAANSDAYLPLKSKIAVASNFNVVDHFGAYNKYWESTQTALFFGNALLPKSADRTATHDLETLREPDDVAGGERDQSLPAIAGVRLNQALVSVGRPGSLAANEDSVQRRLVQTILFHSLGSRLLTTMREFGGDVYTASGAFSVGATQKCRGHDQITLRVSPGSEAKMKAKLAEFTTAMLHPFTEDEVTAARQIVGTSVRAAFKENNMAWSWVSRGDALFTEVESHVMELNGVTAQSLTEWAAEHLAGEWMTSVSCV